MIWKRWSILALLVLVCPSQLLGELVGVDNVTNANEYGTISQQTGQFNLSFTTSSFGSASGLTFDPSSETFFGIFDSSNNAAFYEMDFENQIVNIIGSTGASLQGITYDSDRDTFYATGNARLYTVDRNTGVATEIGLTNSFFLNSLAYNPFDDQLYGTIAYSPGTPDSLVTLDRVTGEASEVAQLSGNRGITGLAIDPSTGVFYATNALSRELVTIDPVSGQTTLIGSTGQGIAALSFGGTAIPEPASCVVLLSTSMALWLRRDRKSVS